VSIKLSLLKVIRLLYQLTLPVSGRRPNVAVQFKQIRTRAAVTSTGWCTPGMGVSVGVQVPCRRFTFMQCKIHEDNYESKAKASP